MKFDLKNIILPSKSIIGIDIGSHSLKFVAFTKEKKELKLADWGYVQLDFPADITHEEKKIFVSEEIKKYLKKKGILSRFAATSVSGNSVIVRYVKLPKLSRKEMNLTLSVEAEPFIPFDINDVNLTYFPLADVVEEGQQKMESVLVAAKKEVIDDRLDILVDAGLEPLIIDVDAFALENLYNSLFPDFDQGAVLALNIGHRVTNLSIISQGVTRVVRDIFISGSTFDKAICKALRIEQGETQSIKKSKGLLVGNQEKEAAIMEYDARHISLSKASVQVMKNLCNEISRSIDYYLSQGGENSISKILLSGGMANFGNLAKYIAAEFKVPAEIVNPLANYARQVKNVPEDHLISMSVAAGLALRQVKDWEE